MLGISSPFESTTNNPATFLCGRHAQHEKVSPGNHVHEIATLLGWGEGDFSGCTWCGFRFGLSHPPLTKRGPSNPLREQDPEWRSPWLLVPQVVRLHPQVPAANGLRRHTSDHRAEDPGKPIQAAVYSSHFPGHCCRREMMRSPQRRCVATKIRGISAAGTVPHPACHGLATTNFQVATEDIAGLTIGARHGSQRVEGIRTSWAF